MGERLRKYASNALRCAVLLAVLAVFAGVSPLFVTLWHKCIITGAFASYALVLLAKWGVVEWLQVHGCRVVAEMASCGFCMSWWACVLFCGVGWLMTGSVAWAPAAFVATMVCRVIK